ncbi:hypothetical protein [Acrocarpospora catenulata]|uniref:hypothetical protein n=1 Tax=Acrocarpospora catenulata TaxID=2836182 RepID=UPI001BDA3CBB|nr:hypothetical protein [Acrocarpospora catenulata]
MRTTTWVLAALVVASAGALAADTSPDGAGRTASHAVESSSRWTLRYTGHGYDRDAPLWLVPAVGGGASLFVRKGPAPGWGMLRWDGNSWKRARLPAQVAKSWWLEVGGSPSGETIWAAVGVSDKYGDQTEHLWRFSGGRWTHRLSRNAQWTGVIDIAVDSRDNAWFVTEFDPDGAPSDVLRWSGNAWHHHRPPADFDLIKVAAAGPEDVWVLSRGERVRMQHWNGVSWKDVRYPCASQPCRGRAYLQQLALAVRPDGHAWAVGPHWADGGSPVVLHWDRTRWEQVDMDVVRTGLTAVRVDPVGGLWIAAAPASGPPYVLNLRDGRWTRSTLREGGRITDIAPVPGTTRLWVQTRRQDPTGPPYGKETALVYELS